MFFLGCQRHSDFHNCCFLYLIKIKTKLSFYVLFFFPAEAQAEEPATEADYGPTSQPHLGDQLHAGCQELSHTHTFIYNTHTHTPYSHTFTISNGGEDSVVNWTCDRVPQTGWGCTLQKKLGLWQYQPWRRKNKRRQMKAKGLDTTRTEGERVLVMSVWVMAENILSTSIFYISISINLKSWYIMFYLFVGTSLEGLCL